MSAAQGWDRNRRRGGGAAGGGGGGSGVGGGSGGSGGRGTGQLNRFVQLSGRPHLPGESRGPGRAGLGARGRGCHLVFPCLSFPGEKGRQAPHGAEGARARPARRGPGVCVPREAPSRESCFRGRRVRLSCPGAVPCGAWPWEVTPARVLSAGEARAGLPGARRGRSHPERESQASRTEERGGGRWWARGGLLGSSVLWNVQRQSGSWRPDFEGGETKIKSKNPGVCDMQTTGESWRPVPSPVQRFYILVCGAVRRP